MEATLADEAMQARLDRALGVAENQRSTIRGLEKALATARTDLGKAEALTRTQSIELQRATRRVRELEAQLASLKGK
jgi:hypothetical protein